MIATIAAALSVVAAITSCLIALWALRVARETGTATRVQADAASHANVHAEQLGQSQAVIHFTGRFFDLMRQAADFNDAQWSYQFWSLHATEYYFFDNRWIPRFMYALWMAELASVYCDDKDAWPSHEKYLERYSTMYPEMYDFFLRLREIAANNPTNMPSRNRQIKNYLEEWMTRDAAHRLPAQARSH